MPIASNRAVSWRFKAARPTRFSCGPGKRGSFQRPLKGGERARRSAYDAVDVFFFFLAQRLQARAQEYSRWVWGWGTEQLPGSGRAGAHCFHALFFLTLAKRLDVEMHCAR